MASTSTDVHVAFTGTSSTEAAVDPALFEALTGLTAYNAAIPFSTPESLAVWTEQAVNPLLTPDILVVGVLPSTLADDPDIMVGPLTRALNPDRPEWWEHSALLRRRGQLVKPDETIARMRLLSSRLWTRSGHQTGYYSESIEAVQSPSLDMAISREKLDALTGLVRRAASRGIRVMILFEPVICGEPESVACLSQSDARAIVERAMDEVGVEVVSGLSDLSVSLFADPAHLNRTGTRLFTESVAASIERLLDMDGDLRAPPHEELGPQVWGGH